ncbi:hypothetical protein PanWU01x14_006960 [Parasponia andersonii]|uniref:Uncharacterized protein n=1 Tax=Parasponia andersonii TaxID=3476 RepID=A0A2P5E3Y4_PARAD|nr:hypothetical protein PanWU01x14_006960 [Parasponia andersonii]
MTSLASSWPAFRHPLRLQPVGGETLTNCLSVRKIYPMHAPAQDRIKCSVWVWSSELLPMVFWRKTLEAPDPHLSR